jgi:hypothetical protein
MRNREDYLQVLTCTYPTYSIGLWMAKGGGERREDVLIMTTRPTQLQTHDGTNHFMIR